MPCHFVYSAIYLRWDMSILPKHLPAEKYETEKALIVIALAAIVEFMGFMYDILCTIIQMDTNFSSLMRAI